MPNARARGPSLRRRAPSWGRRAAGLGLLLAIGCGGAERPPPSPFAAKDTPPPPPAQEPLAPVVGSDAAIPVTAADPSWGSPTAPVTLVAFTDFECPYCAHAHRTLEALKRQYGPATLRVVYKHYPLSFHRNALPAAIAAQAVHTAAGSEAFFAYAETLFHNQRGLSAPNLAAWAEEVGIARGTYRDLIAGDPVRYKLEGDLRLAAELGVQGTPHFRVNGAELNGAQPIGAFRDLIERELAATKALASAGAPAADLYRLRVEQNLRDDPPSKPLADSGDREEPDRVHAVPVGDSPVRGPADALVTMVVFSEYQCPFCKRAEQTVEQLVARYPKDLRIVFKHHPLPFHQHALPAAMLAIEARAQQGDAGFWRASSALFEQSPELSAPALTELSRELGLDARKVADAIASERHRAVTERDQELAERLGARGTPTFFINGRKLVGAQPFATFEQAIEQELERARAMVAAGTPRQQVYDAILEQAEQRP